jgi:hypothetical protein
MQEVRLCEGFPLQAEEVPELRCAGRIREEGRRGQEVGGKYVYPCASGVVSDHAATAVDDLSSGDGQLHRYVSWRLRQQGKISQDEEEKVERRASRSSP